MELGGAGALPGGGKACYYYELTWLARRRQFREVRLTGMIIRLGMIDLVFRAKKKGGSRGTRRGLLSLFGWVLSSPWLTFIHDLGAWQAPTYPLRFALRILPVHTSFESEVFGQILHHTNDDTKSNSSAATYLGSTSPLRSGVAKFTSPSSDHLQLDDIRQLNLTKHDKQKQDWLGDSRTTTV